jgi:chloramphenicol-sensitive protein RarD
MAAITKLDWRRNHRSLGWQLSSRVETLTDTPIPGPTPDAERRQQSGLLVAIACYVLWGFLPLLFAVLEKAGAVTIVADRTVWSLLLVGAMILVSRRRDEVRAVFADGRTLRNLAISSVLLAANWLIYVYAVASEQALQGSFGYFINPLVNVALGMALLGERLNRWQAVAILVAVVAIFLQAAGIGGIPIIALSVAVTFALYGFVRKTAKVESTTGLFVETLMLVPFAIAYLAYTFVRDGGPGIHADPYYLSLLILTGPATAVPLLLFTFAVRRLRLTTIGMLQYLSPSIQFLLAIFVLGEPINSTQLLSFALIWLSLIIYTADSLLRRNRQPVIAT